MRGSALYRRLIRISIRAQLQYKLSAFMRIAGSTMLTAAEFLGLWALFSRFESLESWSLVEVCVFYGVAQVSFGIAKVITTGFDHMAALVRSGSFDRMMLRPRSLILQLLGHEFTLRHAGRILQGAVVLTVGLAGVGPEPTAAVGQAGLGTVAQSGLLLWTIAGGVMLFWGLFVLQACFSFKTVEALEIANVFTYGGVTAASYPISIYVQWFRRFFTFVVPIACVTYYPVLLLIGRRGPLPAAAWVGWATPAAGIVFFLLSLVVWKRSLRWYSSTGS